MDSPNIRAIGGACSTDDGGRAGRAARRRNDAAATRLRLITQRLGCGDVNAAIDKAAATQIGETALPFGLSRPGC